MMVNAFVMSHFDYVTVYTAVAYPSGKYIHVSCSEFTTVPHAQFRKKKIRPDNSRHKRLALTYCWLTHFLTFKILNDLVPWYLSSLLVKYKLARLPLCVSYIFGQISSNLTVSLLCDRCMCTSKTLASLPCTFIQAKADNANFGLGVSIVWFKNPNPYYEVLCTANLSSSNMCQNS